MPSAYLGALQNYRHACVRDAVEKTECLSRYLIIGMSEVLGIAQQRSIRVNYLGNVKNEDLRSVLESLTEPVIVMKGHTIKSVNRAVLSVFGYSSDSELVGQSVSILMNDEDAAVHHFFVSRYENTGKAMIIGNPRSTPRHASPSLFTLCPFPRLPPMSPRYPCPRLSVARSLLSPHHLRFNCSWNMLPYSSLPLSLLSFPPYFPPLHSLCPPFLTTCPGAQP